MTVEVCFDCDIADRACIRMTADEVRELVFRIDDIKETITRLRLKMIAADNVDQTHKFNHAQHYIYEIKRQLKSILARTGAK